MKFSCDRSLLMSAINTVTKALAAKSNIPILEGILITAEGTQGNFSLHRYVPYH